MSTISRYTLGTIFFVLGLNGFLHFLPNPPMPAAAGALIGAFVGSGYLMAFVKATEVLVGASLLSNRYAPLALVVAAPVTLNIVLFHAFLAPAGMGVPLLVLATHLLAAWQYRDSYAPILRARPSSSSKSDVPESEAVALAARS
ncbi:MAG: DoxX family protein [Polyangiaceae bacterium]